MENIADLRANGKLLITGEYLVMLGARALAFPVRFGQSVSVKLTEDEVIRWTATDSHGKWIEGEFSASDLSVLKDVYGNMSFACNLICEARKMNPAFMTNSGHSLSFYLNYPREWGLGSSSSLIWLISQLAHIDKYELYDKVQKGSGFDVACASRKKAFFYTRISPSPLIEETTIGKALRENAVFAYLGNKQPTQSEVEKFMNIKFINQSYIDIISNLGEAISKENEGHFLCKLISEHEKVMEQVLGRKSTGERFPGFPGAIKSLGAWGGDFALFASHHDNNEIKDILSTYGLKDIFTFDELKLPG